MSSRITRRTPASRWNRSPATTTSRRSGPAAIERSVSCADRVAQTPRDTVSGMAPSGQVRLLLVEDVPQVAQYVRGLLNAQTQVKLVDVITDGSQAVAQIVEQRPDVVVIDG